MNGRVIGRLWRYFLLSSLHGASGCADEMRGRFLPLPSHFRAVRLNETAVTGGRWAFDCCYAAEMILSDTKLE